MKRNSKSCQGKGDCSSQKHLSDKRWKKTAEQFKTQVKYELQFLNMPGIEFQVSKGRAVRLTATAVIRFNFLISVNPGEAPQNPLPK